MRRLSFSLGIMAGCLLGFMVLELVVGPGAFASARLPARHLQLLAAVTFAFGAASVWTSDRGATATRRAVVAGLLSAVAMLANTRLVGSGDTRPAAYLPFAVVRTGSLTFEKLIEQAPCLRGAGGGLPYWLVPAGDKVASRYPLLVGLLATPVEMLSALGRFKICSDDFNDLEKLSATILTAAGVGLLFSVLEVIAGLQAAILATIVYVLGTPVLPILGQALWQHTGSAFAISLSLLALVVLRRGSLRAATVSFGAGLVIACRPPDLFLGLGLLAALAVEQPRPRWPLLAFLAPLALLALCNWDTLGAPVASGYGSEAANGWTGVWPEGLFGLLFSPARGILLLYPVLLWGVWGLLSRRAERLTRSQLSILLGSAGATWLLIGKWWDWAGGYSAAPRMLSATLPILAIGLSLAFKRVLESTAAPKCLLAAAGAASIGCACLVTYVPPNATTRALVWSLSKGPWVWEGFPPVAYLRARK